MWKLSEFLCKAAGIVVAIPVTSVMLLAQAMKSSNSIDTRSFLPVLTRLRYKGITANYEFDARHDMKESTVTILRFQDGKLTPLSSF